MYYKMYDYTSFLHFVISFYHPFFRRKRFILAAITCPLGGSWYLGPCPSKPWTPFMLCCWDTTTVATCWRTEQHGMETWYRSHPFTWYHLQAKQIVLKLGSQRSQFLNCQFRLSFSNATDLHVSLRRDVKLLNSVFGDPCNTSNSNPCKSHNSI